MIQHPQKQKSLFTSKIMEIFLDRAAPPSLSCRRDLFPSNPVVTNKNMIFLVSSMQMGDYAEAKVLDS